MPQIHRLIIILILNILITVKSGFSQEQYTQTIRGTIVDKQTQTTLAGATVILLKFDGLQATTQIGTVTDENGNFRLESISIGRQGIRVSYIGYNTITLKNLLLSSGKELILKIELEEKVITTQEIIVKAYSNKAQPINKMATVSARSFTVEETNRYAASYGDPARMVANYAGVMSTSNNRNDIVIRGNSPMGLLWRLDGIEILNPSHFAALGTTGGPITILNSNLLTNSDFFTGAFPAEYGNTLAGVFDLKMRSGNNEKREHWAQIGWNGLEFGAEGPFSAKSKASYLITYRYSLLHIINAVGIDVGTVPEYQDLTFKINTQKTKYGKFILFGIGGLSHIDMFDIDKDREDWTYENSGENLSNGSDIGFLGLSHLYFLNKKTRLKTNLSILGSRVSTKIDTFSFSNITPFTWAGEESSEVKYSFSTHLKKKFNAKNNISAGFIFDIYNINYADSIYKQGKYRKDTDIKENMSLIQSYVQWQHKFTDNFLANTGVHYQQLTYNNTFAVEPRLGLKWNIVENQSISLGFGMHSQVQPRMLYFVQTPLPGNTYIETNNELDFTRSNQAVLGYDYLFNENLRLKFEVYYQSLYDIPVQQKKPAYSLINTGADYFIQREDSLINQGTGENYGIELTFEKFFSNNYYFLITTSLFESKYKGYDNIERNTAFNGNYVVNILGGYEFKIGAHGLMSFGLKATWAGGKPYIPFDVEETLAKGEGILDWDKAYQTKRNDYKRINLRIGLKRNRPKFNIEYAVDLQYGTKSTSFTDIYPERIDVSTGKIKKYYKTGFIPMMTWRIQF